MEGVNTFTQNWEGGTQLVQTPLGSSAMAHKIFIRSDPKWKLPFLPQSGHMQSGSPHSI